MLKIYGRANSINVRKVLWLAHEIGLKFNREDWGRGTRTTSAPEFLALNPFALVPVIDDDGFLLRESHTILRYLATKNDRADLYPTDPVARAGVDVWMDWALAELGNAMRPVFLGGLVKSPRYDFPEMIDAAVADWNAMMAVLDGLLAVQGPYLSGPSLTLADIAVGVYVHRWVSMSFEKPDLAGICAYYELLSKRPGFRAHVMTGLP